MKEFKKAVMKKMASCGKFAAVKAAGSASCAGFHQPAEPKALKNLVK
jgi:cyclic lactone autoinducer peptide